MLRKKVELTWDENDVDRMELNEKVNAGKLNEIPDSELRKFVAYSSEEEDEDVNDNLNNDEPSGSENESNFKKSKSEDVISKYKNLLNDINKKEEEKKKNKVQMEFSWGIDSTSKSETKESTKNKEEVNPFEKLIEKKREKKRERKEKIRNMKKAQQEDIESDDDLPDGIDLNDPYFAEEFANGDFAPVKTKKSKSKKPQPQSDDESDGDKKDDLALLLDDDDNKAHFSLKKIQEQENESKTSKKRRSKLKNKKKNDDKEKVQDDFEINASDSRFSAIYTSHLFNIDPTDSHYRKTKGMETLIEEKLKRKATDTPNHPNSIGNSEPTAKKRNTVENNILVKSIKRKVQQQK